MYLRLGFQQVSWLILLTRRLPIWASSHTFWFLEEHQPGLYSPHHDTWCQGGMPSVVLASLSYLETTSSGAISHGPLPGVA